MDKFVKPQVVTQPSSDDLDDVTEFDDGDSDGEPDAADNKWPIVEEGDSWTYGPEEGAVHCSASSLLLFTCIVLYNFALHNGRHRFA